MTEKSKERFTWCEPDEGWKGKDGKTMSFTEMTESQLNKYYKLSQHKEMVYANKSSVFYDKQREIEKEAKKRRIDLKSLSTEYHTNSKALKS